MAHRARRSYELMAMPGIKNFEVDSVELDEDEKLLMVSKLLVALTSGLHTRPAVNADSVE